MRKETQEALKEGGRLLLVGVVGLIVSVLVEVVVPSLDQTSVVFILAVILKAADKYIHTTDKVKLKGLVPF